MGKKPKVSPDGTYVFQEEDIEEYDELSVTRAMSDASTIIEKKLKEKQKKENADFTIEDLEFDGLEPPDEPDPS